MTFRDFDYIFIVRNRGVFEEIIRNYFNRSVISIWATSYVKSDGVLKLFRKDFVDKIRWKQFFTELWNFDSSPLSKTRIKKFSRFPIASYSSIVNRRNIHEQSPRLWMTMGARKLAHPNFLQSEGKNQRSQSGADGITGTRSGRLFFRNPRGGCCSPRPTFSPTRRNIETVFELSSPLDKYSGTFDGLKRILKRFFFPPFNLNYPQR